MTNICAFQIYSKTITWSIPNVVRYKNVATNHKVYSMSSRLALACFLLLTLSGCTCWDGWDDSYVDDRMFCDGTDTVPRSPAVDLPPPVLSIHCDEITAIVQEVSVNFKHKRRLRLADAKTFYNEEGIHTIQLKYTTQELLDPSVARLLIVDLVDSMTDKLNGNMYLVPEFSHLVFLPSNFEIYISCESYYARYVDPLYIRYICIEDGIITYYAADLNDNNKNCWHVRKESFKTAHSIAVHERKAEEEYNKKYNVDLSAIFGDQRYVPPEE